MRKVRSLEIQKRTTLTKDALRYYEKEGLIQPMKEANGYRVYSEKDLQIVLLIQSYRRMGISIADIKKLLHQEISIYDCLKNHEHNLQLEIKTLDHQLSLIQDMTSRKRCHFVYLNAHNTNPYLLFQNNYIYSSLDDIYIPYKDIESIHISLCSRTYNAQSEDYLKQGAISLLAVRGIGLSYRYDIDLDIVTKINTYHFESHGLSNVVDILKLLEDKHIKIIDPLELIPMFQKNPHPYDFTRFIEHHIKSWKKEFHINHPRGYDMDDLILLTQKEIHKFYNKDEPTI